MQDTTRNETGETSQPLPPASSASLHSLIRDSMNCRYERPGGRQTAAFTPRQSKNIISEFIPARSATITIPERQDVPLYKSSQISTARFQIETTSIMLIVLTPQGTRTGASRIAAMKQIDFSYMKFDFRNYASGIKTTPASS